MPMFRDCVPEQGAAIARFMSGFRTDLSGLRTHWNPR